jgi:hypothetical protein
MKRRLESPTRREIPVEDRRNRPGGEFGSTGGGLKKKRGARILRSAGRGLLYAQRGGRATRRPPEVPRATRAPVPVDPAGA